MDVLEHIIENSVNLFESIIMIEFIIKYNEFKHSKNIKYISSLVTIMLLMLNFYIFGYFSDSPEIMVYSTLIIVCTYTLTMFEGKLYHKLFSVILIIFIVIVINFLTTLFFSILFKISIQDFMSEFSIYRLLCLIASKIILFIISRILFNIKERDIKNLPPVMLILTLSIPIFTIAIMVIITEISLNLVLDDRSTFYLMLSFIGMLIINVVFYGLLLKLDKHYKIKEENLLLNQKYLLQLEHINKFHELYQEIQVIRHDMKNHIIYLKEFFINNQYDEGISYADSIIGKISITRKLINTDNSTFNAIINSKINEAESKNIIFTCNIMCSLDNHMEDYDIICFWGNLFDNAIESCEKQNLNKEIHLEISEVQSYYSIIVSNTIDKSVLKNNPMLKTDKSDKLNHGLGIKSIEKIVKKYNGFVKFEEESDKFFCKVMLLL